MTFLLDHLTAIIVGTVLLGALLVLQQRGQMSAVEATQRHRAQVMAGDLLDTLEREIENARGRDETERVFAVAVGGEAFSPSAYRFRILRGTTADGTSYTRQVSFPTLADPDRGTDSPLGIVTYTLEETGETTFVDGRDRALLIARRYFFPRGGPLVETGVYERIVDFDVTAYEPDGSQITSRLEIAETPVRIHVEIEYAPQLAAARAGDQSASARISTRHARTVRIPASTAYENGGLLVDGSPGGIPPLPGDDDYVDPTPGGGTGGDGGTGDTGGSGDGGTGDGTGSGGADGAHYEMCHSGRTLSLPEAEARIHAAHGDTRGACVDPAGEPRYEMCHSGETLSLPEAEARAHAAHGDPRGACPPPAEEPRYEMCHSGQTISVPLEEAVQHHSHGDARGACGTSPDAVRYEMCHSGRTISVPLEEAVQHHSHGDARGACR